MYRACVLTSCISTLLVMVLLAYVRKAAGVHGGLWQHTIHWRQAQQATHKRLQAQQHSKARSRLVRKLMCSNMQLWNLDNCYSQEA